MNLKQLEAFAAVAELKSFSKAAKKLYLTQPTVSAHIRSLEKELNCRLLIRTTKDVVLSADGERLYHYARQMVKLERNIRTEFQHKKISTQKKICVGASTVPGQYLLPQIISQFIQIYPDYQLELKQDDSNAVIRMVEQEAIEAGFTGTRTDSSRCVFEPFYEDKLMVITPNHERYSKYLSKGFPIRQLYHERLIFREEGSGTRRETMQYLKQMKVNVAELNIIATISNQEVIKKSVSSGMGISIISGVVAEDYVRQGQLLCFPLEQGLIYRNLYMVWNKNSKPGPSSRVLMQFVRELYQRL